MQNWLQRQLLHPTIKKFQKDVKTQAPSDPVHLDVDQSEVDTERSTPWWSHAVCSFTPKMRSRCPELLLMLDQAPSESMCFTDGSQTLSTLGVKYAKTKPKGLLGFMHRDPRTQRIWPGSTNDFGAFLFNITGLFYTNVTKKKKR